MTADERAASAWIGAGGRLGGCVPPSAGPYEKGLRLTRREKENGAKPTPVCSQADLRNIYYGLLGPEAQSITYVLDGQRHTLPTVGADGAYMFVTLASAHQLLNFANAGTSDIVPVDGPIKEIHYRDGSTCHLTSKSWIGGAYACTPSLSEPVGYRHRRQSAERRRGRRTDPHAHQPRTSRPLPDHDQLHRAAGGHRRTSRVRHLLA